jgi:hypothetical protein
MESPPINRLMNAIILRRWKDEAQLVKHVQVTRNFGVVGGWLRCEFYTHPSGDPTGVTESRVEYPHV